MPDTLTLEAHGALTIVAADLPTGASRQLVQIMAVTDGVATNGPFKFEVTQSDLESYAASIRAAGDRRPIDYDHTGADGGSTVAAGWFTGVAEVRPGELWAEVEWTSIAADQIRNKQFRFFSPEFDFHERDKQGVLRKAKDILAGTLTNRPFFNRMAPVTATKEDQMTDVVNPDILKALGLDEKSDLAAVVAAIAAKTEETEQAKADAEKVTAQLAVRPDLKPDDLKSLIASAAKGEQAAKELHDMRRDALLSAAVTAGKILPVQKAGFATMYDLDPEGVTKLVDETPEKSFAAKGSGDGAADDPNIVKTMVSAGEELPVDEETATLHAKAIQVLAKAGKSLQTATTDEYVNAVAVARVSTD